jgi:hypothetical protein
MVRSQEQPRSGHSRSPITIENDICRWPIDVITGATSLAGRDPESCDHIIRSDPENCRIREVNLSSPRKVIETLPPVVLRGTHVVFSGAVFGQAWFVGHVHGAASRADDMNDAAAVGALPRSGRRTEVLKAIAG